jgi:hypothetical protein
MNPLMTGNFSLFSSPRKNEVDDTCWTTLVRCEVARSASPSSNRRGSITPRRKSPANASAIVLDARAGVEAAKTSARSNRDRYDRTFRDVGSNTFVVVVVVVGAGWDGDAPASPSVFCLDSSTGSEFRSLEKGRTGATSQEIDEVPSRQLQMNHFKIRFCIQMHRL